MSDEAFIIELSHDGCRIGRCAERAMRWTSVSDPLPLDPAAWAAAVKAALVSAGWRSGAVGVIPASELCLAATVSTARLPRRGRREALQYRLEEKLPLAADDLISDFIPGRQAALGIAIAHDPMVPRLLALAALGARVAWICPAIFLAYRSVDSNEAWNVLLWGTAAGAELILRQNDQILAWHPVQSPDDLPLHLRHAAIQLNGRARVLARDLSPDWLSVIQTEPAAELFDHNPTSMMDTAALVIPHFAQGRRPPSPNLAVDLNRPSPLALPGFRAAAAATFLLILSVTAAMFVRARQYSAAADDLERRQQQAFSDLFPDQPPPVDVLSRLSSEERRLRALSSPAELSERVSSLIVLRDLLTALPKQPRYRILDLKLDENGLQLDGEAHSHADANALALGLRATPYLQIDAPRSEKLSDDAVSFTIVGLPREAAR